MMGKGLFYIQDGRLEIDSNRSQRCIKGIVLGLKNYLFMGSSQDEEAAAVIYSLIETCKQKNVDPLAYLTDVLARLPIHPNKRICDLLPYNWKPPLLKEEQTKKIA
jgi:transposase